MHRIDPRLARKLVCAAVAVPVLLAAGCSSDSEDDTDDASSPEPSKSKKIEPVKFKQLPDPCDALSKKTIKDVVPGAKKQKGKNLASDDTESYGSCLWSGGSGKNDAEYRSLTVSLKRYDSSASLGSGTKQAGRFFEEEVKSVTGDDKKKVEKEELSQLGQKASAISYETEKKGDKYRVNRTIAWNHNVVVTVDYEGTGFEGADLPSHKDLKEKAEKTAKETVQSVK